MKLLEKIVIMLFVPPIEGSVVTARGKPVSSSSIHGTLIPEKAVDGDRNSTYPNVFHSAQDQSSAWWSVDLGEVVDSPQLTIYFRTDYILRRNGVRISLSPGEGATNDFCHVVTGAADGSDIPGIYNFTCAAKGRYLNISTITAYDGEGAVLDFGEVEVYGEIVTTATTSATQPTLVSASSVGTSSSSTPSTVLETSPTTTSTTTPSAGTSPSSSSTSTLSTTSPASGTSSTSTVSTTQAVGTSPPSSSTPTPSTPTPSAGTSQSSSSTSTLSTKPAAGASSSSTPSTTTSSDGTIFATTTIDPGTSTTAAPSTSTSTWTSADPNGPVLAWDHYGRPVRKKCACRCKIPSLPTVVKEAEVKANETKKELTLDKSTLTKQVAKKISKEDDRKSSNGIGTSALALIGFTAAIVVLPDFLVLLKWCCKSR